MFMNLLVLIVVLAIGYAWMVRGVFNAMIHAMCVFFAGALAFGLWEPLSMMLINVSPSTGFAAALGDAAWGLGLIIPFIIFTLILRVATDKLVTANIKSASAMDYAGGAVFGLFAGMISAGILVIGVGYMRLPTGFLGYQPVWYHDARDGYLVKTDTLWVPADTITATIYKNLSMGSMSASEPLAKWYPDLTLTGFAQRLSPEGAGRNVIKPEDFRAVSSYIVGDKNTAAQDLLEQGEVYTTIDGKEYNTPSTAKNAATLAGYVIEFEPGAKEAGAKGGQVLVSNGQVRLLLEDDSTGETSTAFPIATISESSEPGQYGRWAYDTADTFISSTGGKSRVQMGFEFLVPPDSTPIALYVRGVRVDVDEFGQAQAFRSRAARDKLIPSGSLLTGSVEAREFDTSDATVVENVIDTQIARFSVSLGTIISSQTAKQRGVTLDDDNRIVSTSPSGSLFIREEHGRRNAPAGKALRVEQFSVAEGQSLVYVNVGEDNDGIIAGGLLSDAFRSVDQNETFLLVDSNGNEYEAIGYLFEEGTTGELKLRYTPSATLGSTTDAPALSKSKTGQKLRLLFLVTEDVEIDYFTVGPKVLMEFDPPMK